MGMNNPYSEAIVQGITKAFNIALPKGEAYHIIGPKVPRETKCSLR